MAARETAGDARAPARAAAAIKLRMLGVSKTYPAARGATLEAVRDVTFEVPEGQFCVLLGPSGCGKSTLLRMVAGLDLPSAGRVLVDGREIAGPGRDRGMVFQSYTSFEWLTVAQNVEYGMRLHGVPAEERRARARRYIDLVRLGRFRDAYPRQLSGGMRQRVAIARTLANGPSMLLMDEPFGALDAETRWQMQELLLDVVREAATTVVMVTHDIEEALLLADRILFVSRRPGRVVLDVKTDFKLGRGTALKEDLIGSPEYLVLQRRILALMREHGSRDDA